MQKNKAVRKFELPAALIPTTGEVSAAFIGPWKCTSKNGLAVKGNPLQPFCKEVFYEVQRHKRKRPLGLMPLHSQ